MLKCTMCHKKVSYVQALTRGGIAVTVYWCNKCGRVWEHYGQEARTKRVIH